MEEAESPAPPMDAAGSTHGETPEPSGLGRREKRPRRAALAGAGVVAAAAAAGSERRPRGVVCRQCRALKVRRHAMGASARLCGGCPGALEKGLCVSECVCRTERVDQAGHRTPYDMSRPPQSKAWVLPLWMVLSNTILDSPTTNTDDDRTPSPSPSHQPPVHPQILCSGTFPCQRCWRLALPCRPQEYAAPSACCNDTKAGGGAASGRPEEEGAEDRSAPSPLLGLAFSRAAPRACAELTARAFMALHAKGQVAREKALFVM